MPGIEALAERLSTYLGPEQVNLVRRAYFTPNRHTTGSAAAAASPT